MVGNTQPDALWSVIILNIRVSVRGGFRKWNTGGSFFWKALIQLLPVFSWSCTRSGTVWSWNWNNTGVYSAKSYYQVIKSGGRTKWPFQEVWSAKIPKTVRIFLYLFLQDRLLTQEVLLRRNISCATQCHLCTTGRLETSIHIFFKCRYAVRAWARMASLMGLSIITISGDLLTTWKNTMFNLKSKGEEQYRRGRVGVMSMCWHLWLNRNQHIFRGTSVPPEITAERAVMLHIYG